MRSPPKSTSDASCGVRFSADDRVRPELDVAAEGDRGGAHGAVDRHVAAEGDHRVGHAPVHRRRRRRTPRPTVPFVPWRHVHVLAELDLLPRAAARSRRARRRRPGRARRGRLGGPVAAGLGDLVPACAGPAIARPSITNTAASAASASDGRSTLRDAVVSHGVTSASRHVVSSSSRRGKELASARAAPDRAPRRRVLLPRAGAATLAPAARVPALRIGGRRAAGAGAVTGATGPAGAGGAGGAGGAAAGGAARGRAAPEHHLCPAGAHPTPRVQHVQRHEEHQDAERQADQAEPRAVASRCR